MRYKEMIDLLKTKTPENIELAIKSLEHEYKTNIYLAIGLSGLTIGLILGIALALGKLPIIKS